MPKDEKVTPLPEPDPAQEWFEKVNRDGFRAMLKAKGLQAFPCLMLRFPARNEQLRLPFERMVFAIKSRRYEGGLQPVTFVVPLPPHFIKGTATLGRSIDVMVAIANAGI